MNIADRERVFLSPGQAYIAPSATMETTISAVDARKPRQARRREGADEIAIMVFSVEAVTVVTAQSLRLQHQWDEQGSPGERDRDHRQGDPRD